MSLKSPGSLVAWEPSLPATVGIGVRQSKTLPKKQLDFLFSPMLLPPIARALRTSAAAVFPRVEVGSPTLQPLGFFSTE